MVDKKISSIIELFFDFDAEVVLIMPFSLIIVAIISVCEHWMNIKFDFGSKHANFVVCKSLMMIMILLR